MALNSSFFNQLLSTAALWKPDRADALARPYSYEPEHPLKVREEVLPHPSHRLSRLTFTKRGGQTLTGLFMRPLAEGRYPCALLLHALSSDKAQITGHFGAPLADRGLATLALDAHLHGERRRDSDERLSPLEYLNLARETVVEYRQALAYLESREDVDAERIGLLGYSLGAMMGCILAGVDERVRACCLMVGGDLVRGYMERVPAVLRRTLESVSPANFVGRIAPRPVYFLNGRWDSTVPAEAARLLHEAAGEPKEIVWADAGHLLPPDVARLGVEWLTERLTAAPAR